MDSISRPLSAVSQASAWSALALGTGAFSLSKVQAFPPKLALFLICSGIALPFVVLASIKFQRDSNQAYLVVRDQIGGTLSNLQESIAGVRVIQAFGRERTETRRFAERNRVLYDAHMQSVKVQAWYLPVIELAGIGTTAAVTGRRTAAAAPRFP